VCRPPANRVFQRRARRGPAHQSPGLADRVVTVSEESLSRGLLLCLERAKQVAEPAGAAGVAALLEHSRDFPFTPPVVVMVLSGDNIDPAAATQAAPARPCSRRPLPRVPLQAAGSSGITGETAR